MSSSEEIPELDRIRIAFLHVIDLEIHIFVETHECSNLVVDRWVCHCVFLHLNV